MMEMPMTREEVLFVRERLVRAVNGGHKALVNDLAITDAALREELAQVKQERDEAKEEVAWYGTLVRRTKIGTHETPSLKAYIEQLEARIAALEGEA
jgi:hypothetical protein